MATDSSAAALDVAQRNAVKHGLEVEFRHGRWFEPLAGERFDLIVANPPYVADGDHHLRQLRLRAAGRRSSGGRMASTASGRLRPRRRAISCRGAGC